MSVARLCSRSLKNNMLCHVRSAPKVSIKIYTSHFDIQNLGALSKILLNIHFTSACPFSLLLVVLLVAVQWFSFACVQPTVFDCVRGLGIF